RFGVRNWVVARAGSGTSVVGMFVPTRMTPPCRGVAALAIAGETRRPRPAAAPARSSARRSSVSIGIVRGERVAPMHYLQASGMSRTFVGAGLKLAVTLLAVSALVFALTELPGDPAKRTLGEGATPAQLAI